VRAPSRGGTTGSKRRPPDQARTSILAAAERLFYAEGIAAVGVDAVAEAARVTKRTLYYHFASKDALVAAYLTARDAVTIETLRAVPEGRAGDRILGSFDFVERWASTSDYRGCPFNNAVAEYGTSPDVVAIAQRHKDTMKSWFTELARTGGASDADTLGAQLLVLLDGALNGAAVARSPAPVAVARAMAAAILDDAGVPRTKARDARPRRRD
jgi:AcrR family transcriptional regulator